MAFALFPPWARVGGMPVILDILAGTTDGTPPPTGASFSAAAANQTKLQAKKRKTPLLLRGADLAA